MGKLRELQSIKKLVISVMEKDPQTRNSDSYLYLKVLEVIARQNGIDLSKITVPEFYTNRQDIFPNTETVRRTRQKVQAERPDLQASDRVAEARVTNQQAFFDFARGC